jgi:exodeoxyribonuclease VII large subunit
LEKAISLSELNQNIKLNIQKNFSNNFYIVAEISELNENRGNAYLQLIEKSDNDFVKAKASATIWASTYRMLKPYFETTTGHSFQAGLKVLLVVKVEFHEIYGYSLSIKDIDPSYTIGDIEKKRLQIIKRLEEEGVLNMNKEIELAIVPQKIAVISSETAAGYGDFIKQLNENEFGYKFYTKLFPAAMQGDDTEGSIIEALDKIYRYETLFDAVVIIRGGGSKADLSRFDSYQLALNIAQFPIPVLTGIGHDRDRSTADLAAHTSLKTPTAVAEFLIDAVSEFDRYLHELSKRLYIQVQGIINQEKQKNETFKSDLKLMLNSILKEKRNHLNVSKIVMKNAVRSVIQNRQHSLSLYPQKLRHSFQKLMSKEEQKLQFVRFSLKNNTENLLSVQNNLIETYTIKNYFLNPETQLQRGYSITLKNKLPVKSIKELKKGDLITTKLIDGEIKSKVEN